MNYRNVNRSGTAATVDEREPRRTDVRSGSTQDVKKKVVIRIKSTSRIAVKNGRLRVIPG
jgi:hypothetical protein